jgi:hypothetical protein
MSCCRDSGVCSSCETAKPAHATLAQIDFNTAGAYRFTHGFGYQALHQTLYQHREVWHGTDQGDRQWNEHL